MNVRSLSLLTIAFATWVAAQIVFAVLSGMHTTFDTVVWVFGCVLNVPFGAAVGALWAERFFTCP